MSNIAKIHPFQDHYEVVNSELVEDVLDKLKSNFIKGERSIAFSSTNYQSLQHKCIFLSAQYLHGIYPNIKIGIVTFNWDKGIIKPFFDESETVNLFTKKFHHHFHLIDWANLFHDENAQDRLKEYDLLLWDMPDIDFIKNNYDLLKDQVVLIDTLYVISLKNKHFTDDDFLESIQKYYFDHGLDISKVLPWKKKVEKVTRNGASIFKKLTQVLLGKTIVIFLILIFQGCSYQFSPTTSFKTLKGMHDTIGGLQSEGGLQVEKISHTPVEVLSSDFGFSTHPNDDYRKRNDLLKKFIALGPQKKIITISYHQCRPDIEGACAFEGGVANHFFNEGEWRELLTRDSPLNKKWKIQMRELGDFISSLKKNNIKIYLRPYHESNLPLFWWSDVKHPEHSVALWRMLHDFYVNEMKLDNIVWVWSIAFHPKHISEIKKFYPGDDMVDVLGVDIYPPAKNVEPLFSSAWSLLREVSTKKPLALSEVSRLPSKEELQRHDWYYVVPWGITMLKRDNTESEIGNFYKK